MQSSSRTYLSLAAFYAADPRRRDSRERDVGLWWRSVRGPTYRAAWVQDTGELYLFQHALTGPGSGSVHVMAERFDSAELERRVDGWRDHVGRSGSLEWLMEALRGREPARPQAGSRPAATASRHPSGTGPGRFPRAGSSAGRRAGRARTRA
jgi:hypothetical protein